MPGGAFIFGLMGCTNCRILDSAKPKSLTYDTDVIVGTENTSHPESVTVLLHFFTPLGEKDREEDNVYLISGRVGSISSRIVVGEDFKPDTYDIEIEAFTVRSSSSLLPRLLTHFIDGSDAS